MNNRFKDLLEIFKNGTVFHSGCKSPDPVKVCDVYKNEGCTHVDGYLCCVRTCDILKKYKQGGVLK